MLLSSREYLQALRDGKYLLFLEWPSFIAKHYSDANVFEQSADELVDLLIFDWLNNGFREEDEHLEEDIKSIALLFKIHGLRSRPLQRNLDYAFTSILAAATQCMTYRKLDLLKKYHCEKALNKQEVTAFMKERNVDFVSADYERALQEQRAQFAVWVAAIPNQKVESTLAEINPMLQLRYKVEEYLDVLERARLPPNDLRGARIGVVRRLVQYVNEQPVLTVEIQREVASYTAKIWDLAPDKFEEAYIITISPRSIADSAWRLFTDLGMGFFHLIQSQTSSSAAPDIPKEPKP